MARTFIDETPELTPGNHIYLYRLLRDALGCGKQTFLPAVEEALASDRMTADDLGFADTRALLEVLDEFVQLTVFKGGRIYATVVAQPAWDEALAGSDAGKQKNAGKTRPAYKKKKGDKALKPVRPKRVKHAEPEAEPAVEAKPAQVPEPTREPELEPEPTRAPEPEPEPVQAPEPVPESEAMREPELLPTSETPEQQERGSEPAPEPDFQSEPAAATTAPAPAAPSISLTITYDPYNESTQGQQETSEPKTQVPEAQVKSVQHESEPTQHVPEPQGNRPSEVALASYPKDFAAEVYLASERVAELCELLPYGTDVFTLLARDYSRARALELISGTRAKCTFPLRIEHENSATPIVVTLKKRNAGGLTWELEGAQ